MSCIYCTKTISIHTVSRLPITSYLFLPIANCLFLQLSELAQCGLSWPMLWMMLWGYELCTCCLRVWLAYCSLDPLKQHRHYLSMCWRQYKFLPGRISSPQNTTCSRLTRKRSDNKGMPWKQVKNKVNHVGDSWQVYKLCCLWAFSSLLVCSVR